MSKRQMLLKISVEQLHHQACLMDLLHQIAKEPTSEATFRLANAIRLSQSINQEIIKITDLLAKYGEDAA